MKSWPVLLAALCGSCAALQRTGDRAVEVGAGTAVGTLLWFLGPAGVIGGALAALGGSITALLVGGGDTTVHEAPSNGWDMAVGIGAVALVVLLLRSWNHWLPPAVEVIKRTAKGTPRALLGVAAKKPPARFKRRID